jgi:diguanylate cyclase (GGDEF)-like protein
VAISDGEDLPGASAVHARPQSLIARARASEFLTQGASKRFLAGQRRRVRTAARVGFLVIATVVGIDAVALIGLGSDGARAAVVLDAVVMVGALAGWWLLPRQLSRRPEAVAWLITTGVVISTVVTGYLVPELTVQSLAFLLILPGLIALVLPWRTSVHLRWLLVFAVVSMGWLLSDPAGRFTAAERGDLSIVLVGTILASIAGHVLLQRAAIGGFVRLEAIRALRRQAQRDMLDLEGAHRELEKTARIDPLTGAGNRRRLDEDVAAIRAHIDRSGMTYGLLEIDLDHFKAINDTLGHLAGDDVLRRVVGGIKTTLRATDALYRFGGEEFMVILPAPDLESLVAAAERMRQVVLDLDIEHPGNEEHGVVSVSIGATLVGSSDLVLSTDQWFRLTDRAMYEAKSRGRNQVCWGARAA